MQYSFPALLAAGVLVAAAASPMATSLAPAASTPVSLWPTSTVPKVPATSDNASVELGVKFHADVNGTVSAVRYYKSASNTGTHTGSLWSATGTRLATATFTGGTATGWQTVTFAKPVAITANTNYVASYLAPVGHYAEDTGYFTGKTRDSGVLHAPANAGVYHYGASGGFPTGTYQGANYYVDVVFNPGTSTTPTTPPPSTTPSTPPPSSTPSSTGCSATKNVAGGRDPWGGCFPGANNTGVPSGTALTAYTGGSTLSGTITGKRLTGDFVVSGSAIISKSEIDGSLRTSGSGKVSLTDVTVVGSRSDQQFSNVQGSNITALRANIHDGRGNFQCMDNCSITDSWVHDPYIVGNTHYDAIGSNGMTGFTIKHNTVSCTDHAAQAGATGGCSADIGFFGDFGKIDKITASQNLFVASNDSAGYCLIAAWAETGKPYPNGTNQVFTNNVWQKGANGHCGQYGAIPHWGAPAGSGNVWSGNTWDDGTVLNP